MQTGMDNVCPVSAGKVYEIYEILDIATAISLIQRLERLVGNCYTPWDKISIQLFPVVSVLDKKVFSSDPKSINSHKFLWIKRLKCVSFALQI